MSGRKSFEIALKLLFRSDRNGAFLDNPPTLIATTTPLIILAVFGAVILIGIIGVVVAIKVGGGRPSNPSSITDQDGVQLEMVGRIEIEGGQFFVVNGSVFVWKDVHLTVNKKYTVELGDIDPGERKGASLTSSFEP